ncbi:Uncharacterized protein dnm_082110 [Desulfonema magnum]|uniref:Uncharacterized protein n=1 Tax=Desulfonema magnum TaxID=45655 RepID=A0A975BUM5_9BACT|nr:Uncharacterized protein dnm_082110 [Desulfonema magnum]
MKYQYYIIAGIIVALEISKVFLIQFLKKQQEKKEETENLN